MRIPFRTAGLWPASMLALLLAASACSDRTPLGAGPADEAQASAGAQDELFVLAPDAPLSADQQRRLTRLQGLGTTAELHVARLAETPRALLQQGRALVLNVGAGKRFVALGERGGQRETGTGGYLAWSGPLQNAEGWVDLVLTDKGVTGALYTATETYSFQPVGGGLQVVVRVDRGKVPPDHGPGAPRRAPEARMASALTAPVAPPPTRDLLASRTPANYAGPFQDLLVVYTASTAAAYYDVAGLINFAIEQTNQSYENSYVNLAVYLAGTAQVSYSEANRDFTTHVSSLTGATNGLENVPTLRNNAIADAVLMLVDDTDGNTVCGQANRIQATQSTAFAVVSWTCISASSFTFPHELGHLQGADHDVDNDCDNIGYTCGSYAYNHGYIAPNQAWRTIMAYKPASCSLCTRVNYWSNPYVTYSDGQAMGTASTHYNTLVLDNTRYTIRDFRTLPAPANLTHANSGVANVKPTLTWNAVSGIDLYYVQRCVVSNGQSYSDSCFYRPDGPNIYTNSFTELQITQTGSISGSYNCPRIAHYRVRSWSRHGISSYNGQVSICVY